MGSENQALTCSLIIPAYNAEKSINHCLDSLLNQSVSKDTYEIIVVDDGSIDNTANIISKYESVKLIQQSNHGPATARNRGASEAKGEILNFTDSDCELDPDFLKNILSRFDESSQVVGVQGCYKTKQKEFIAQFGQVEIETRYIKMEQHRYIDFIGTYAAAYRTDIFRNAGGFDTSFPAACGEDVDFSYRLNEKGYNLVFAREALVYHLHPSTLKRYLRVKFYRGFWRVKLHRKHMAKTFKDSYTPHAIKIEILISPVLPFCLFLSYWNVYFWLPIILIILFFLYSSCSFLKLFREMNYSRSYFVPFMLYARAISIFAGVCSGMVNEFVFENNKTR